MAIKYLFFPFTYISENQLNTILTFFPSFHCLPMVRDFEHHSGLNKLCEQKKINPVFVSSDLLEKVDQTLEQYLAWAQIHRGNEINLKALVKDSPYFTNDSDVTAIKSQIKGEQYGKGTAEDAGNALACESTLENDLLFLKLAQLCDEQNEGIDAALNDLDIIHDTLISNLRGIENCPGEAQDGKSKGRKDLGAMMTCRRISAWSRCMVAMGGLSLKEDIPLFITTSEAVFDYLESNCKDVVNALDIGQIKVHENECKNKSEWHHHFFENLMCAIQGQGILENDLPQVNDNCSLFGQIKLCLFSGNDINNLFNMSDKQIFVCLIKLK
jgi:hypothetical protein